MAEYRWIVDKLFGGDTATAEIDLYQVAARAAAVYLVGLILVRLGKSRSIGRVTAVDAIIGFTLGSLLGRAITGHASLSDTFVACAALEAAHWLTTFLACRSHALGTLLKGHARPIVIDGQIDVRAMLSSHISIHDLNGEVRMNGLERIDQVKLACKERNGQISVVSRPSDPRVFEIAVQNGVQTVRIEFAN